MFLGKGKVMRLCFSNQATSKQLIAEMPTSEVLSINSRHSVLSAAVSSFTRHSQI